MKHIKLTFALTGAIFLLGLLALNMYSSSSMPGFSGDAGCYHCHNDPVYISDVGATNLPIWNATSKWPDTSGFSAVQDYSVNYIPVVPVIDPVYADQPNSNLEFIKMNFVTNDSHISILTRIEIDTISANDAFAIVWNIDSGNFSTGHFIDLSAMKLEDGTADMWVWRQSVVNANSSGMASDDHITTQARLTDTTQDVEVAASFGVVSSHSGATGYYVQFTRARSTGDTDDVQFGDGAFIAFGIAWWNATSSIQHHSSFDKAVVVGPSIEQTVTVNPYQTVTQQHTQTLTETETVLDEDTITITTGQASAFTAIIAISTIIAIPVIFRLRRK